MLTARTHEWYWLGDKADHETAATGLAQVGASTGVGAITATLAFPFGAVMQDWLRERRGTVTLCLGVVMHHFLT